MPVFKNTLTVLDKFLAGFYVSNKVNGSPCKPHTDRPLISYLLLTLLLSFWNITKYFSTLFGWLFVQLIPKQQCRVHEIRVNLFFKFFFSSKNWKTQQIQSTSCSLRRGRHQLHQRTQHEFQQETVALLRSVHWRDTPELGTGHSYLGILDDGKESCYWGGVLDVFVDI